ncbi:MFS transporter [Pseudonocardia sp. T1-2H]|uniref:MFS transporter n=1 Tax=Pseudonocardia sp. T1-2H TaxID=3128899 RepID=UPI003100ED6C
MTSPGQSVTETAEVRRSLPRVVLASLVGATIEWYDFFLYSAAAALVFNTVFFPASDPLVGTMLALGTYALGFVARPVGGIVFGHFGDRVGRKQLLMISLIMMGLATVGIGLLPTYAQVGIWAPIMLVVLRLIQGFAVGGEWGGAVLLVAEYGTAKGRGFWTSWPQVGVPAGNLLAAGVLAVLAGFQSDADFEAWGWRIPFLLSAVLVLIGYWIRQSVAETPVFVEAQRRAAERKQRIERSPAIEAVRRHPRGLLLGMGLRLGENVTYYIVTAFSLVYATEVVGLPKSVILNAVLVAAAVQVAMLPAWGALSDRFGRRPVLAIGALGTAIWGFAFFRLLETGATVNVVIAMVVGLVLHGAMSGPEAAFISEMFSTPVRYSASSIAYQLSSILAGSVAPIIALELFRRTGSATAISIYLVATCAVSLVAIVVARENKGRTFEEIDAEYEAKAAKREVAA